MKLPILALCLIVLFPFFPLAQSLDNTAIRSMIEDYKNDPRGPYRDIQWFCPDGTFAKPRAEKLCDDMENAVQRARYKPEVIELGERNHVFLGQILSKTELFDFWDAENYNSRLKQYQLEKYLRAVDDGWVLRQGQYYRGAYQVEDEMKWAEDFLKWLLAEDDRIKKQFFLVRQTAQDLVHSEENDHTQKVRALSKTISEKYKPFLDLRVKIHGQPDRGDIGRVVDFREKHEKKLAAPLKEQFDELVNEMHIVYRPINITSLNEHLRKLPKGNDLRKAAEQYVDDFQTVELPAARAMATAELLYKIREGFLTVDGRTARLALLDLSNALENIYLRDVAEWKTNSAAEVMNKICYDGLAATGSGLIEMWEWEALESDLAVPLESFTMSDLNYFLDRSRSLVEWGTNTVRGVYRDVVDLYAGFEPMAHGFYDDVIRSSVLLNLGGSVGQLSDFTAKEAGLSNDVMKLSNQSQIRGLNPGYALGELVVVENADEGFEVDKEKIYVFDRPPADLKPVTGIVTVSEGNMVSHVQLLARNLAIPNAVLSSQNFDDLKKYNGDKVFYAVSNKGTVIMKPIDKMSEEEESLFAVKVRSEEKVEVPIDRTDLSQTKVLNMRQVDASSSGKICGPKAANLGQLKKLFPDHVVEGLVIPFGIFRQHMEQQMPDAECSYWQYLNHIFVTAEIWRKNGKSELEVENYTLEELATLRDAIQKMELQPEFVADLRKGFVSAFGEKIGSVPVFLRSDTNMEDLKDFTGAGLNLTLFNVVDDEKILQGIKDVWASPYRERGYKWRQRYLLNPENVFPSILIIPSVDVEYSGVMITKGIPTADSRDITIAFSRGAGGAVDGQAAESYLLRHDGQNILLSPAREPLYRRLPESGGSDMLFATFDHYILNQKNAHDLRVLAYELYQKFPEMQGPYDVEGGFKDDKLWLFQVRPFVENKGALSSAYLESITPKVDSGKRINLNAKLM